MRNSHLGQSAQPQLKRQIAPKEYGQTKELGVIWHQTFQVLGGSMSASAIPQQSELLTSWKEIASYLGKGVRTVQRWEQQYGLPVRRPNEKAKGIVHATRHELDSWLDSQWSQKSNEFDQTRKIDYACYTQVRAGLSQSAALRQANRALLKDVRSCVQTMILQCELLARNLDSTAKQSS